MHTNKCTEPVIISLLMLEILPAELAESLSLLDIQTNSMKMRTVINLGKYAYLERDCMKLRMIMHISDVIIFQSIHVCVLWVCVTVPENRTFIFEEIIEKCGKMRLQKKKRKKKDV